VELFQAVFLGIVQGLTEFFPISSSAHLIIIPKILHWGDLLNSLTFNVALHLGTATALILFFWKEWISLFKSFAKNLIFNRKDLLDDKKSKQFLLIFLGSMPAGIIGALFKEFIEENTRSLILIGANLILFGFLLWFFDKNGKKNKKIEQINFLDAIFIGISQATALIPGVSRSGVTITAARYLNIDRESAVRFSFLLSAPAVAGAALITMKDLIQAGLSNPSVFTIGFLASFISGFFAIKFLIILSRTKDFNIFVIYRFILGAFLILLGFFF
jgi:undecaprenyl-diphosphatase